MSYVRTLSSSTPFTCFVACVSYVAVDSAFGCCQRYPSIRRRDIVANESSRLLSSAIKVNVSNRAGSEWPTSRRHGPSSACSDTVSPTHSTTKWTKLDFFRSVWSRHHKNDNESKNKVALCCASNNLLPIQVIGFAVTAKTDLFSSKPKRLNSLQYFRYEVILTNYDHASKN